MSQKSLSISLTYLLNLGFILFTICFYLDIKWLFPNHLFTIVSLCINPIIGLIGILVSILYRKWLFILPFFLILASFPLGMMLGYSLSFETNFMLSLLILYIFIFSSFALSYYFILQLKALEAIKSYYLLLCLTLLSLLPILLSPWFDFHLNL
ncbi:hypothetical protein STRIC_0893 [Streptococcus ictaluri 707-05]|uniref:Uncharacterized protein n=1 Tax=Streptococcus ictaluri 707-05 TaxID=764299 RepID=G5K029_9STRE|nr:hypothetical protein STRIC_0893 [Streptococcus ictaluri 707-05]